MHGSDGSAYATLIARLNAGLKASTGMSPTFHAASATFAFDPHGLLHDIGTHRPAALCVGTAGRCRECEEGGE